LLLKLLKYFLCPLLWAVWLQTVLLRMTRKSCLFGVLKASNNMNVHEFPKTRDIFCYPLNRFSVPVMQMFGHLMVPQNSWILHFFLHIFPFFFLSKCDICTCQFNFTFQLAYIDSMGIHCDNSINSCSVLWTSSAPWMW
jgi:hypothetical protein